jgi:addiction module HigA family antidote
MSNRKIEPIHPGEVLLEEFLKPIGITQYRLAKDISVPPRRINEIIHGKRSVSVDTALRLSRYFGLSERFWLNLQARYDLEVEKDKLEKRIENEVKVLSQQRQSAQHKTSGSVLPLKLYLPLIKCIV